MNLLDLQVDVEYKVSERMHNFKLNRGNGYENIYCDVSLKEIFMDYKIRLTMR